MIVWLAVGPHESMIRSTGIFLPSAVVVLIWCIGVSSAAPQPSEDYNPSDVNWRNFKANFKKNYVTVPEDNSRLVSSLDELLVEKVWTCIQFGNKTKSEVVEC